MNTLHTSTSWQQRPKPSWRRSHCEILWWLEATGALTQHLSRFGEVGVEVISESVQRTHSDEREALQATIQDRLWVREIFLILNHRPVVAARSICFFQDALTHWKAIRALGSRPLAQILYQRKIHRSALESAQLSCTHPLAKLANTEKSRNVPIHRLFARRSVFTHRQKHPLLVSECFLPSFREILTSIKK